MRYVPTRPLRSALLALLLSLCLALPALAAPKEGLLLVAFGTSVPEAQPALTAIDADFKAAFPDSPVVWAYTSSIIREKLAKQGTHIGDVNAGLEELARRKVDVVRVQSLHVVAGEEFSEMERLLVSWLTRHPDAFKAVYLGRPLLESRQDADEVCRAVLGATEGRRKPGELLALMGHGQSHGRGDMVIEGMRATLSYADNLAVLATVEGSHGFDEVLSRIRTSRASVIWLQPFMVVAGDHARNDLAGDDPDSWASKIRALGLTPRPVLTGLGELPGVRAVFVRHARDSHDDLMKK